MSNKTITLTVDESCIDKMINFYKEHIVDSTNEYVNKLIKLDNVTITIYTSNKVVFQGDKATYEASIWDNSLLKDLNLDEDEEDTKPAKKTKTKAKVVTTKDNNKKEWVYTKEHMGSDEVGTGDYFGPISVCAAYVKHSDIPFLNKLGVDDSKKITDENIMKIAPYLLKNIPYSQISLSPEKYNALTDQGYNQAKIKSMLHNQVIHNLKNKMNKHAIFTVIDQFISETRYFDYVKFSPFIEGGIHFETKAEGKYPSVAVASIIARYSFLTKMDKLSKKLGKEIPKGAGKDVDEFAKELVKEKGPGILKKVAKIHFANTKKILG